MNDDFTAVSYATNSDNVIKVYLKKRKVWLAESEIAVLYNKSIEVINGIIIKLISNKKYRRNYVVYDETTLYDIKIIEEIGKILDSKNGILLKAMIKEKIRNNKEYKDISGWYILDIIVDIIFALLDN